MAGFPKKTIERLSGARQIGTRTESIPETLSVAQVEGERAKVCDLLRESARVKEEHKTATARARMRLQELEEQKEIALRNANTGRREVEVNIQEWLDRGNQVLRIRADTGDIIGDRTARVDELQETLFKDDATDGDSEEDTEGEDDSDGDGEADETEDQPSNPDGDFGDTGNE